MAAILILIAAMFLTFYIFDIFVHQKYNAADMIVSIILIRLWMYGMHSSFFLFFFFIVFSVSCSNTRCPCMHVAHVPQATAYWD